MTPDTYWLEMYYDKRGAVRWRLVRENDGVRDIEISGQKTFKGETAVDDAEKHALFYIHDRFTYEKRQCLEGK